MSNWLSKKPWAIQLLWLSCTDVWWSDWTMKVKLSPAATSRCSNKWVEPLLLWSRQQCRGTMEPNTTTGLIIAHSVSCKNPKQMSTLRFRLELCYLSHSFGLDVSAISQMTVIFSLIQSSAEIVPLPETSGPLDYQTLVGPSSSGGSAAQNGQ